MGSYRKSWDSYKKRLLPWIMSKYRLNANSLAAKTAAVDDGKILKQLQTTFALHQLQEKQSVAMTPGHALYSTLGFDLQRRKSKIVDAGLGVFVARGQISEGQVAALYPGTVYNSHNAIFFQSIRNSFVFKCKDHMYVDGKDSGLSKKIYKSCAGRDRVGPYELCDITWLHSKQINSPLNVGQYVNNRNKEFAANVQYQEFDFPQDFPLYLRRFIPNISVNGLHCPTAHRTVVLIAIKDIPENEELLSTYLTVVS